MTQPLLNIAIAGCNGRMGQTLLRAVASHAQCRLTAASVPPGCDWVGKDAGSAAHMAPLGIMVTDRAAALFDAADLVVDFTAPEHTLELAAIAAARAKALVSGTTGLSAAQQQELRACAAKGARIVHCGNMSVGVNLLSALVEQTAARLGEEFDIEILEMHHRHKVDAPSGTALLLGEAAASGRKVALREQRVSTRDGHTGPRREGSIGFATLRGGDVVGDHCVIFAGPGERIELSHKAASRDIFAQGALRAAVWLATQKAGLYSMRDVLGL